MKVLSFGSLNIDYVYHVNHIVNKGETLSSTALDTIPGGKGLNQSVALAKAGAEVYHAGKVGEEGKFLLDWCEHNNVNTKWVEVLQASKTGHAIIQVDEKGENSIVLFGGANQEMTKEYVNKVLDDFESGDILLLQNEINNLSYIIDEAYKKNMIVVLNPSPMNEKIFQCDLRKVAMFLLNEVEGEQISGTSDELEMIDLLRKKYPGSEFVLTLGSKGAYYFDRKSLFYQESYKVNAVDTTAAGDTFTGYFVASILDNKPVEEAMKIAAKAASIAVTRKGASVSIPFLNEVL